MTLNKGPVPLWLPAGPEKGKEQKREGGTSVEVAFSSLPVSRRRAGLFVGTHALTSEGRSGIL